jgi:hypothetical protein
VGGGGQLVGCSLYNATALAAHHTASSSARTHSAPRPRVGLPALARACVGVFCRMRGLGAGAFGGMPLSMPGGLGFGGLGGPKATAGAPKPKAAAPKAKDTKDATGGGKTGLPLTPHLTDGWGAGVRVYRVGLIRGMGCSVLENRRYCVGLICPLPAPPPCPLCTAVLLQVVSDPRSPSSASLSRRRRRLRGRSPWSLRTRRPQVPCPGHDPIL